MANIIKAYHGEMREESTKQEYKHCFDAKAWVNQKWIIVK